MRPWISGALVAGLALAAAPPALGQAPEPADAPPRTSTSTTIDLEALEARIRSRLRQELREELKAEIKEELAAEAAVMAPVEDDAWAEEEWKWEEPVEPELNFLEFDGYFRLRWDLFNNLDLGTFRAIRREGQEELIDEFIFGPYAEPWAFSREALNGELGFPVGEAPPIPQCPTDAGEGGCFGAEGVPDDIDTLASANMRLRLEPTLNVFEDIKIKSQIDVLDNVVLGSNPDSFPYNPISPLAVFSRTQTPTSEGLNDVFSDAIRVKRLWGEVTTPLGQLRFGRQPDHFGMGILHNEGADLDNDFGDNVDRVLFSAKLGDFYIMPAYDWVVSGPLSGPPTQPFGQEFDRGERDDVEQWNLIVIKKDSDEVVRQRLQNDRVSWEAGGYGTFRRQNWDVPDFYREGNIDNQATENRLVERNAAIGTGAFWGKIQWRKLVVEAEYAFIYGNINDSAVTRTEEDGFGTDGDSIELHQHGGAARGQYSFLKNDALKIELLFAFATGDADPGWGVRPLLGRGQNLERLGGIWDGDQSVNNSITNFRFNPAFNFDLILWRQLVGTLTDGLVIRPSVQYNITKELGARLDVIYSRALFASSTPSESLEEAVVTSGGSNADLGGQSEDLGFEIDLKLFFDSDDGFHAWFQYGLFIPMDGLDRLVPTVSDDTQFLVGGTGVERIDASLAHTLQLMLGITF